ncbi:MAG: exo-beta-1,3-glucanase [Cellvibrionales bacterium]|jgi:exo-beta-1,3-glucanase (GH17 family)|nr:exo-beta-1,3-glucanase [Cellvibrionales bacterium]TXH49148.1 MAG: exo-beta-1,3-glucanase [Cellvibrionales bacterium]
MADSVSSAKKSFLLLLCVGLAALAWWAVIHPRSIASEWREPLKSASFAPFSDGQSPLKEVFPTRSQVEADLVRLQGVFSGVRTYTSQDGMEAVPELAAKYGFALTHSAWLGREKIDNDKEVAALIETANRYPQAVKRVIVGNEVLLRRDLKPDELIAYIDQVRAAVQQPVSYADVWAFWLKNPQVADHVDYITIHILPYWEDEPVSLHDAQQHMLAIIEKIKQRFPGKPILVGETGWPTEGRSRGPAHADLLTAAEFVRALPKLAAEHDFDYNIVEAYDQSWKAQLEGTVGARWGLFDSARVEKFPLTGPVVPLDDAMARAVTSVVLGVLISLLLLPYLRTAQQVIFLSVWSQLFSAAIVWAVYKSLRLSVAPASITWLAQRALFFMADQQWLSDASVAYWYKLLLQTLAEPFAKLWGGVLAVFSVLFALGGVQWLVALLKHKQSSAAVHWVRRGFALYAVGAMAFALMFSTSGRYMDIPVALYGLPIILAGGLWLSRRCMPEIPLRASAVYAWNIRAKLLLPLAALACVWGEVSAMLHGEDFVTMHPLLNEQIPLIANSLLANHQLLLWCLLCVLLALPFRRAEQLA